ncbi:MULTISPECIES: hypothetical protein [Cyanophyceae]|uniref:Uncharacterized protein n=1 Tax=Stenomitos frigidus AS-A4 TaxID=2933935 RepID=A0ABV0KI56_9CYAN|nr:hypothetical protein [Phormidium sp. FACHB-592]
MLDSSPLLEFSHTHCVAICAFLVPANLLSTLQTIVYVGLKRPVGKIWQTVGLASLFALLMVLHVLTWFVVGVVMLPTFVLLMLGSVCLSTNLWAALHPQSMRRLLHYLGCKLKALWAFTASGATLS